MFIDVVCMVEEDCKPAANQIAVEVELAAAPKLVVGVHANVPPPPPPVLKSVPQKKTPLDHSSLPVVESHACKPSTYSLEGLAVPETVSAVDDAYTKREVDDACRPAANQMAVEVELAAAP